MSEVWDAITVDLTRFDWQGVSAITDLLMVALNIILIISVVVGYKSLRQSVLTRDASLLTWAMERMDSIKDDLLKVRNAPIYGTLDSIQCDDFASPWPPEVEQAAYRVSVELQRLSYMVNAGLISKEHFTAMWGPTFVRAWAALELWVKHKRLRNGEPAELADGGYSRADWERFVLACG